MFSSMSCWKSEWRKKKKEEPIGRKEKFALGIGKSTEPEKRKARKWQIPTVRPWKRRACRVVLWQEAGLLLFLESDVRGRGGSGSYMKDGSLLWGWPLPFAKDQIPVIRFSPQFTEGTNDWVVVWKAGHLQSSMSSCDNVCVALRCSKQTGALGCFSHLSPYTFKSLELCFPKSLIRRLHISMSWLWCLYTSDTSNLLGIPLPISCESCYLQN